MSIARCSVCDTQYDQDFYVEHEDECVTEELTERLAECVADKIVTEEELDQWVDNCEDFCGENLKVYVASIKLIVAKRLS